MANLYLDVLFGGYSFFSLGESCLSRSTVRRALTQSVLSVCGVAMSPMGIDFFVGRASQV